VDSERKNRLLDMEKVKNCGDLQFKEDCHPLCKLSFVHEIKHTGWGNWL